MMKIQKSYEIFESFEILCGKLLCKILKFYVKFEICLNCKILTFFCSFIGRLEMKSRLWLENVETPNRQKQTQAQTYLTRGVLTAREVELRKCCLGQSEKSEIPYYLMINVCIRKKADSNSSLQKWAYDLRLKGTYPRVL